MRWLSDEIIILIAKFSSEKTLNKMPFHLPENIYQKCFEKLQQKCRVRSYKVLLNEAINRRMCYDCHKCTIRLNTITDVFLVCDECYDSDYNMGMAVIICTIC